jgi:Na+-driven multidrug efflux pump
MDGESAPLAGKLYRRFILSIALVLVGNLGARVLVEHGVGPPWLAAVTAVVAVLPLALTAIRCRGLLREFDELVQRVALEGFSIALLIFLPMAALYVNLRSAGVYLPRLDPPELVMTPALLVMLGIHIAWRRYR